MPRTIRGAHVVREGAQSHGRTEEKDLARRARGMRRSHQALPHEAHAECPNCGELKRPAPRLQPLRPLRWARSGRGREGAAGRCPGLRPDRGAPLVRPSTLTGPFTLGGGRHGRRQRAGHGCAGPGNRRRAPSRGALPADRRRAGADAAARRAQARRAPPAPCAMRPTSSATT